MRIFAVAFVMTVCVTLPQASTAEDLSQPSQKVSQSPVEIELSQLLQKLGINLIAKAHAAECTEEGETCASNEQCCSGLVCTGGPPATCTVED
jgi:hypothetical protein